MDWIQNLKISIPEILSFLLTLLILLPILAWSIWIIGRIFRKYWYFPQSRVCLYFHNNLPSWWKNAGKLLFYKPENLNVLGFILTLLWPLIVGMNLTLLAQIFELITPGGKRIVLSLVGTYSTLPLIMGILWAVSQAVLGILFEHVKSKGAKIGIFVIASLTVVAETGLAIWRAWIISTGQEMISPTIWDKAMFIGGPLLAGILGFIIPVVEIVSSSIAFPHFIEPMVKGILRWIAGLIVGIWCCYSWLTFGFHEPPPQPRRWVQLPSSIRDLLSNIKKIKKELKKLNETPKEVSSKIGNINKLLGDVKSYGDLEKEIDKLEKEKDKIKSDWETWRSSARTDIKNLTNIISINEVTFDLKRKKKDFIQRIEDTLTKVKRLPPWIKDSPNKIIKINGEFTFTENLIRKIRNEIDMIESEKKNQKQWANDANAVLLGEPRPSPPCLSAPQVTELRRDIDTENLCIQKINAAINELNKIETQISNLENNINDLENKLSSVKSKIPPLFTKPQQAGLMGRVINLIKDLPKLKDDILSEIKQMRKLCKEKKLELGRLAWFQWILPWYWVKWLYYCSARKGMEKSNTVKRS